MDEPDQIDLEHRVDVVRVLLLEQAAGHEPGVVDEQIERRQRAGRLLDGLPRREVDGEVSDLARPARRRSGRLGVGGAHAAEEQLERARSKLLGNRTSDAAARAGYECCGSGEIHGC